MRYIDLRGCLWVDDDIIKLIALLCPQLQGLCVEGCRKVTERSQPEIAKLRFSGIKFRKVESICGNQVMIKFSWKKSTKLLFEGLPINALQIHRNTHMGENPQEELETWLKLHGKHLQKLDLSECSWADDKLKHSIAKLFPHVQFIKIYF